MDYAACQAMRTATFWWLSEEVDPPSSLKEIWLPSETGRTITLHMGHPENGKTETVPRHTEVPDLLARKICRGLSVTELGR